MKRLLSSLFAFLVLPLNIASACKPKLSSSHRVPRDISTRQIQILDSLKEKSLDPTKQTALPRVQVLGYGYVTFVLLFLLHAEAISAEPFAKGRSLGKRYLGENRVRDLYGQVYSRKQPDRVSTTGDTAFAVLGRWTWGPCYAIDARGNYAYISNGRTFQVLDISNPSTPRIIGEYLIDADFVDIHIRDSLAFVASAPGLLILNISRPDALIKVGEAVIPGAIRAVVIDSFAYVTSSGGTMCVVDISDPTTPKLRGLIGAGGDFPSGLAASGRYVYVGTADYPDLAVIDARNPDTLTRTFTGIDGWGISAFVRDSLLFIGTRTYLDIFSVSNPASPSFLGHVYVGDVIQAIVTSDSMAYITTMDSGTYAINISNVSSAGVIGRYRSPVATYLGGLRIAKSSNVVYLAYYDGLLALDVSRPDSMKQASFFPTGGFSSNVALKNNLAYLASGLSGLWILDISIPQQPRPVSNVMTGGFVSDVIVEENYAYLVNASVYNIPDSLHGLWILGIADSASPQVLSHFNVHTPGAMSKVDNLIFITQVPSAGNDTAVEIVNVRDPTRPSLLGVFKSPYIPYNIAVTDSIFFLATEQNGLRIVDWRDASSPVEIASFSHGNVWGVAVRDSFAYADRIDTFFVLNISNPTSPTVLGTFGRNYGSFSSINLTATQNFVYWVAGSLGMVDVSDPAHPVERSLFVPADAGRGAAARENKIFLADQTAGLCILRNNLITSVNEGGKSILPKRLELVQNYPNPFNPTTIIEFSLPEGQHVLLGVFDVMGRKIRTLVDDNLEAGKHRVLVDGSDLPSGVYFYRLMTAEQPTARKMVRIR